LWSFAGLGAFNGAWMMLFSGPKSVPQQGAVGALAAASAMIPYVAARAWDEAVGRHERLQK
jgi:hypothetical protein